MNICGIDPGTTKTGITHISGTPKKPKFKTELIGYDCDASELPKVGDRLLYIVPEICKRINETKPELVIMEYPFGISGNGKIVLELFGIIRYHCLVNKIKFVPLQAAKLKKYATGRGRCEKSDMRMQAYKELGIDAGEDVCDSVFVSHFGMSLLYPETINKQWRQESVDAFNGIKKVKKKKADDEVPV
jgi:Holliday junction resolvasome RuvABC endonuclease subunit